MEENIKGECMDMCPKEEINMREREKLVHVLEIVPGTENNKLPKADRGRMVKSFSRSAAGKKMQDPKNLRPPDVLLKTVNYLLDKIISNKKLCWTIVYDFITDRLRSVRQDMIIQNISRAHSIVILQPIIRFHTYSAYRLCEENANNFDPFLNKKHVQECLKRLLCLYDDTDELFCNTYMGISEEFILENRPLFEALYVILNLGETEAISRTLSLPRKWRHHEVVQLSITIGLSYLSNNFIRICREMKKLPILLFMLASLKLPAIRRTALRIMSTAYNSKNLLFPIPVLRELLLYNSNDEVIQDCKHYGLICEENAVRFSKTDFNDQKSETPPKHLHVIDQHLSNCDISTLVLYGH